MKVVEIIRIEGGDAGSFGVMRIDKQALCVTLEPADRFNTKFTSAIPTGQYLCRKTDSAKFGKTFMVLNVPNRERVLFHPGNVPEDTQGCVVLAQHFGKLNGDRAVLNSGETFKNFLEYMEPDDMFHLTIYDHY
jgi:hypothetical protein